MRDWSITRFFEGTLWLKDKAGHLDRYINPGYCSQHVKPGWSGQSTTISFQIVPISWLLLKGVIFTNRLGQHSVVAVPVFFQRPGRSHADWLDLMISWTGICWTTCSSWAHLCQDLTVTPCGTSRPHYLPSEVSMLAWNSVALLLSPNCLCLLCPWYCLIWNRGLSEYLKFFVRI